MRIGYDAKRIFHNNSGLGNYGRDLLRIFQERSDKKVVYYLFNPKKAKQKRITYTTNTKEILPKTPFWKKLKSIWRLCKITDLAAHYKLDLYHGISGEIPIGIRKTKIPTIVTIHDLIFMRYPELYRFWDRKIHFYKFKYAAKKANHIIAISEQTKKDIIHYLKVEEHKISVVYQGCNAAFKKTYTTTAKKKVQEKFKLPDTFILNVGTIEPRKNALTLVKAAHQTKTPVVLIGRQTAYAKKIKTYIEEHKLEKQVFFLSNVSQEELAIIYQLSSIFCYPSIFEGFGIPIIEALYSKTPVITSKDSCFPEAAGQHSIYISAYDVKDLAFKIKLLLSNTTYRQEVIEKGYEYAQKFSDNNVYKNTITAYQKAL